MGLPSLIRLSKRLVYGSAIVIADHGRSSEQAFVRSD